MSPVGAVGVIVTFGALTAAAFGFLPSFTLFLSLPLLLAGALYDSWRDSRAKRRNARG